MKICSKCHRDLGLADFHKKTGRPGGVQTICKDCARDALNVWRKINRERFLKNGAAYRVANQEKIIAVREAYKERGREKSAAYAAANPERKKKMDADYYAANKERIKKNVAIWAAANRTRCRVLSRLWKRANPACGANDRAKRRAQERKATASWGNKFFIREIYDLAALRTKATAIAWHVDHKIPINSPLICGLHVEHNLQLLPAMVNVTKGNRFLE